MLSGSQQPFGVEPGLDARLMFGPVYHGDSLAEGITLRAVQFGRLDGLDAAPFLPPLGFDLAHFSAGVLAAAVITIDVCWMGHVFSRGMWIFD